VSRRAALRALLMSGALTLAGCGLQASAGGDFATGRAHAKHVKVAKAPGADWPTFGFNAQRTGVGPARTGISPGNLSRLRTRVVHLNGTVDSAPIELHAVSVRGRRRDVVVVTTTYGRTIAIDPGTGAHLWEYTPGDLRAYDRSAQVTTASPTADPDRRYVYAATPDGFIHKLALASGREVRRGRWPARITFDATHEKIASALNISGPWVVAVTGGYIGDAPPYQGHVALISRSSGAVAHVFNTLCSDRHSLIVPSSCRASDSAIWGREGSVIEPGSHRILIATGNAPYNGSTNWGDSVLELSADAGRLLHNWTPRNQAQLEASDTDLGSTEPALLPGGLIAQGGKAGVLSLIDLGALGRPGRLGGELQDISTPGHGEVFTAPAVWGHRGQTYVFVAIDGGTGAYVLRGRRLGVRWQNGTSGTSPVVAGGLLYVYDEGDGALNVYLPATGRRLASLPAQSGHWNSPIVAGGRIILPTGSYHDHSDSGTLLIYHLPGR
jgi:outer membrane protein assembly factor BamB